MIKTFWLVFLMTFAGSLLADPPGATYSPELQQHLAATLKAQGKDYQPRTRHLLADGAPVYTNRLIKEDSPYLLQHAHNPVDWYPWGSEAFARAKRENKPVFLSIGYSTCHWCHVMEHESFEDEAVAEYLNTHFIAIKIDRERRPDIDKIYMTAVQVFGKRGGWPMSSFLTTDGKTFFAGTYFPRDQFMSLLHQASKFWNEDQLGILAQADKIAEQVQRYVNQAGTAGQLANAAPGFAVTRLRERHEEVKNGVGGGGFSSAPKFPNEANYLFLIDYARRHEDPALSQLIRFDLNAIASGGIHDHVGGGFHRYSTDKDWLIPHFEKMLYNQAQMSRVYLQAASLLGEEGFSRVARRILDYVLRDMRAPDGGFYSATDADSEGHEGVFFLWTPDQVRGQLSQSDAELVIERFNISQDGNFEGSNILHLSDFMNDTPPAGQSQHEFGQRMDGIRAQLYTAREQRVHPGRDEKIVTAWNAMMIMALAEAAVLPDSQRYAEAALQCGTFLWNHHRERGGQLWRASFNGRSSVGAVQEDYAWLADAFISLYDLSHNKKWLDRARNLLENMQELFWDEANGGYFMSSPSGEVATAMGRAKDINDGAVPGGNAVALHALARLARRPGKRDDFLQADQIANELLATFGPTVNRNPSIFPYLLMAAGVLLDGESGAQQYAAHGGVAVSGQLQGNQLSVNISIQPGWHINAHQPLSENLVPTLLQVSQHNTVMGLSGVSYPSATTKTLGFQSESLALYEGNISLSATIDPASQTDVLLRLQLQLQACDYEVCLPPEKLQLQVPVAGKNIH